MEIIKIMYVYYICVVLCKWVRIVLWWATIFVEKVCSVNVLLSHSTELSPPEVHTSPYFTPLHKCSPLKRKSEKIVQASFRSVIMLLLRC